MTTNSAASVTNPYLETAATIHAYRRIGKAGGPPPMCLQHVTGILDQWDPHGGSHLADVGHRQGGR